MDLELDGSGEHELIVGTVRDRFGVVLFGPVQLAFPGTYLRPGAPALGAAISTVSTLPCAMSRQA